MKPRTQDIYGTPRSRRDRALLADANQTAVLARPWIEAERRRMVSTIVFSGVLVLCTVAIVAVVVWYQVSSTRKPTAQWRGRAAAAPEEAVSTLDTQTDAQTMLLLDELRDQRPIKQANGATPLNVQSIKQATYHLIQAEKAEKEDRSTDALDHYDKALALFPDLKGAQRRIAMIHLKQEDYPAAVSALENVQLEEELTFGLANNLGVAYLAMDEYDKAEQNLLVAVRLNSSYPLAYFNLATLYSRVGDLEKSVQFFEKYLELKPDDVSAGQTYALTLLQLKQWEKAVGALEQVTRAAPEVAPLHFRLAEAYVQIQRPRAAIDALRRGTTLVDPRRALAWMSQSGFDPIRDDPMFRALLKELGSTD